MSKPFNFLFLLYFLSFLAVHAQNNNKIDSLTEALTAAPKDSTRIEILVNLWRVTAYSNQRQSLTYAREIIRESEAINFSQGVATGYQRLGISQSYLGLRDSIIYNYRKALDIYKSTNSKSLQGVMLYNIGLEFQNRSVYDSASYYIQQAGHLFEEMNDTLRIGAVHEGLGGISKEKGDYRIALQHFMKAVQIFEKVNNSMRLSTSYLEVGDSFYQLANYEKALIYYNKAKSIAGRNNDLQVITSSMISIGMAQHEQSKYDSAVYSLERSVTLADSLESPWYLTQALFSLAIAHFEEESYEKALPLFRQSLGIARSKDYQLYVASNLINIGWINFYNNDLQLARQHVEEGIKKAIETDVKENTKSGFELLSKIYAKQGDYKKALDFQIKFKSINDSIYNSTKSAQMAELQTLYETEKKENEIAHQKEEIKLLNQEARIDRLRKFLLAVGLVAAIVIGGLIAYSFRQKIKREKAEREKERSDYEKELAFAKKQLTTHTLHLVQKNELLSDLSSRISDIKRESTDHKSELNRILQLIKNDTQADKDWENFKMYFEQVHEDFDEKLRNKINDLTNNEMRLAALMKMNLSTKEIATILNISPDSVNKARYRLRKKLNLSPDDSLNDFILAL